MKKYNPNKYEGKVVAPSSKSYLQRAIAIASFVEGESKIEGFYASDDALVALEIAKSIGVETKLEGTTLYINKGKLNAGKIHINVGEAGLSTRMFAPIFALKGLHVEMNGEGSILSRPQDMVIEALEELGVEHEHNNGFLPIEIHGRNTNNNIKIDGSSSSQLLTGLLIAYCVSGIEGVISVSDLKSKPYVDMTIELLSHYGFCVRNNKYQSFEIPANQTPKNSDYQVEGDWSGASFLAVSGAIGGEVVLSNLNPESKQSDVLILDAIKKAGAQISFLEDEIKITKDHLFAFEIDLTEAPDLFPPVCVLAIASHGISKIAGVSRLKYKESDRGTILQQEFSKLGARIELIGDEMWVHGNGYLEGGKMDSNNDHRIAMAGAIASLISQEEIKIENEWAINKSYPTFYDDFEKGIK